MEEMENNVEEVEILTEILRGDKITADVRFFLWLFASRIELGVNF